MPRPGASGCASPWRRRRPALVHADREWLRQVVEGLIDNALRHGAPLSRITVRQGAGRIGVRIAVEDDGRGIPPQRAGLFERFARGAASIPDSGSASPLRNGW